MARPLFKWPGGKRWLAPVICEFASRALSTQGTYFEPFAGGAAVFFELQPARAVLSDINGELIEVYDVVRKCPADVLRVLKKLKVTRDDYYRIRATKPTSAVGRAARLLYLNRTAFAGMYRVNRKGQFNVPYGGRSTRVLWEQSIICDAAAALRNSVLVACDFEVQLRRAKRGDFVYCDPTYTVAHSNNGFVRYNERNFSWTDQERLAKSAVAAARRGATVVVSNAEHTDVSDLYRGWTVETVQRQSLVCPRPTARGPVNELLFISNAQLAT